MPPRRSAGVLLFRTAADTGLEVLLGHPGGPFWARRDDGAWSIPKGEYGPQEEPRAAAHREFAEELGAPVPAGREIGLGEFRLPTGKRLTVYAVEADFEPARAVSNMFQMEWPPRSGQLREFPELDRVAWFAMAPARRKLAKGQAEFLDRLVTALGPTNGTIAGDGGQSSAHDSAVSGS
ncbi:MAG TPA: NUDIX domain-containing protein [Pseudonocardia sp.]|uniref:NUDIX domain-containing protein n=1 Tax=Pseudonocardia sp. TaxID=60912 RepID=UPI002F410917